MMTLTEGKTSGANREPAVAYNDFWQWLIDEIDRRGIPYRVIAEAGGYSHASTVWRAANEKSELTIPMISAIAKGLGMSRIDVMRKIKETNGESFLVIRPEDLQGASLTSIEIYQLANLLPDDRQQDLLEFVKAMLVSSSKRDDKPKKSTETT